MRRPTQRTMVTIVDAVIVVAVFAAFVMLFTS